MIQILWRIYLRPMLRSLRLLNEGLLNQDPKKYEIKWVYLKISWNHNTNFTFEEVRLGTSGGTSSSCSTSRSRCGLRCCCCFFQTSEVVEVIIVVVVIVAADGSADAQAGFFCHWNFRKNPWKQYSLSFHLTILFVWLDIFTWCKGGVAWNKVSTAPGWSTSSKSSMSSSRSSSSRPGGWRPPLSTRK